MTSIIRWTTTFAIPMGLLRAYNIARGNDVVSELMGFIVGVATAFALLYVINRVTGGKLEKGLG